MKNAEGSKYQHRILTIPNALSLLRLLMIPLFVWQYAGKHNSLGTGILLLLSGLTDVLDGFIARRFHMISDLGKALDPVVDKLTQIAILLCLAVHFPLILLPLIVLVMKEVTDGIMGLVIINISGEVYGADWHGKVTTALLYVTVILHVIWADIPQKLSQGLLLLCSGMLALSFLLYLIRNTRLIYAGPAAEETFEQEKRGE